MKWEKSLWKKSTNDDARKDGKIEANSRKSKASSGESTCFQSLSLYTNRNTFYFFSQFKNTILCLSLKPPLSCSLSLSLSISFQNSLSLSLIWLQIRPRFPFRFSNFLSLKLHGISRVCVSIFSAALVTVYFFFFLSMSSASSSAKVCYNSECKELKSERARKGWKLRNGEFADLCDRCA